jgi:hypothetical protein
MSLVSANVYGFLGYLFILLYDLVKLGVYLVGDNVCVAVHFSKQTLP